MKRSVRLFASTALILLLALTSGCSGGSRGTGTYSSSFNRSPTNEHNSLSDGKRRCSDHTSAELEDAPLADCHRSEDGYLLRKKTPR